MSNLQLPKEQGGWTLTNKDFKCKALFYTRLWFLCTKNSSITILMRKWKLNGPIAKPLMYTAFQPEYPISVTMLWTRYNWSVRKVSDLWPGKRNWLTWSVGHLITLKVVPLGLHTLLPVVPPLLEACRKSLFRNGV